MKIKFKGFKKDDGTRGSCKIRGELYEPGGEYEVDEGLGNWLLAKDLAELIKKKEKIPETPKPVTPTPVAPTAESMTAYEKLQQLVGAHTVQIYGDTGTGKSRLVHTIAMETQNVLGKKVLYLDTEGSLSPEMEDELENYEYVGPDLDALIERMRLAKMQRDKFDLLIIDSLGFPVLTSYASLPLEKRLAAILSLTNILADSVRFARASKHEKLPAPEKMNLSIVTNQPLSEFTRVAKGLSPETPLDPFGGKLSFIPKMTLRSEVVEYGQGRSVFRLITHKSRHLERGREILRYTITDEGVRLEWKTKTSDITSASSLHNED